MSRDDYRDYSPRGFPDRGDSAFQRADDAQAARRRLAEEYSSRLGQGDGGYYRGGRRPASRRRVRSPRRLILTIVFLGMAAFTVGFISMWSLGSVIVGGSAFGGSGGGQVSAGALTVQSDYQVEPLVDLLAFRDLAYVPVKAVHILPMRTQKVGFVDNVAAMIDQTEINSLVITIKDEKGRLAYDSDLALGKKYGTIQPGMGVLDLDAFLQKLAEHNIMPIARVVCFKDNVLARKRPEMAVQDGKGGVFVDSDAEPSSWLDPYNHDVWEYLTQVGEEAVRRGFREVQFDYVRFPTSGIQNATYPGRYGAKEDAVAGFLAYARPRLEALGAWVSADVFGLVVKETDDLGMGQQLEKISQSVDILSPMVYPSLYTSWQYGVSNPVQMPYDIVKAALGDAKRRLTGTGTKCRPLITIVKYKSTPAIYYSPEEIKEEIRAAEEQGFNEWVLWGGYDLEALRSPDGVYPQIGAAATGTGSTSTTTPTAGGQ